MRIIAVVVALLITAPAFGAACDSSGAGNTALEIAANGLSAGQWCEMTPAMLNFTENATNIRDVLSACGNADNVAQYANNMAFDPSQGAAGKIGWWGTSHGGSHRFIVYDVGTNEFGVGPALTTSVFCSTGGSCSTSWESSSVSPCASCNAEHGYDGMATDQAGSFYHAGYADAQMYKITLPSAVDYNFTDCDQEVFGTGALDFWPDYGTSGTFVALCGYGNNHLQLYDLSTSDWSNPFGQISWGGGGDGNLHNMVNYNAGSGEVWVTQGDDSSPKHYRLHLVGGTPTRTALSAPPFNLGMYNNKAVADPVDTSGKFVVWKVSQDTVGTSNSGWYEFDMGTDTWTTFASLGITSMPPLTSNKADPGNMSVLSVSIPQYGVTVWLTHDVDEGQNIGGMFLYRHSDNDSGATPPPPPASPRAS